MNRLPAVRAVKQRLLIFALAIPSFAVAAPDSRQAAIQLSARVNEKWSNNGFGAFISADGHALVDIQPLVTKQLPKCSLPNGKTIELQGILQIFTEQELALVKFQHRPERFLKLATQEPKPEEELTLLPLKIGDMLDNRVPPVVGRIMLRRKIISSNLQKLQFVTVFSFGAGISPIEQNRLGPGCFAFNHAGELVAFLVGTKTLPSQTLTYLAPVSPLRADIKQLEKRGQYVQFPLPDDRNPIDAAALDSDYHGLNTAMRAMDWVRAEQLLKGLRFRHPQSAQLRLNESYIAGVQGKLNAVEEPDPSAAKAEQVRFWERRAELFAAMGLRDQAIETYERAIALCPKEYPSPQMSLAELLSNIPDNEKKAEELFRSCERFAWDSIDYVEGFKLLMLRLEKDEEFDRLEKIERELENIYFNW